MSIVLKPGSAGGSIRNPADLMLEPDRLEEKTGEEKIWLTWLVDQAIRLTR